ncbi:MAG: carbohydrate kinase family protein [Clostridia bacterium]|nr:carbohydrate kinase family protein [Clostridia bacterium]
MKTAILTLDKDGACVFDSDQGFFRAPVAKGTFVSAVGAGDSFCACFLYHDFQKTPLSTTLEKANRLAGYVVSREEAIPDYPETLKEEIR